MTSTPAAPGTAATESVPQVAVLMSPDLRRRLISAADWDRLLSIADVRYADDRATQPEAWSIGALATAQTCIAVTGWDTSPMGPHLARMPKLQLIAHSGGSVRQLVPATAFEEGMQVSQAAAVLADGVAEFAVLGILAGLRRLVEFHQQLSTGIGWQATHAPPGRLLHGKTVGVIGASRVGRATITLLSVFGCQLVVYDPFLSAEEATKLGVRSTTLQDLLRQSDVVTLHAPLLPTTTAMIGKAELAAMTDGALLINTARAGLVDHDALAEELRSGRLSAVLDVFPAEPMAPEDPWRHMPGTTITPHIAALTEETLIDQGRSVVDEVERFLSGRPLAHRIDRSSYDHLA